MFAEVDSDEDFDSNELTSQEAKDSFDSDFDMPENEINEEEVYDQKKSGKHHKTDKNAIVDIKKK